MPKEEILKHEDALKLSNPIDLPPIGYLLKVQMIDFVWIINTWLLDLVNNLTTEKIWARHLKSLNFGYNATNIFKVHDLSAWKSLMCMLGKTYKVNF